MPEPYLTSEERGDGYVTVRRLGEAPEEIVVTLDLIASADHRYVRVHRDVLEILGNSYKVVGWDPDLGGLVCRRE